MKSEQEVINTQLIAIAGYHNERMQIGGEVNESFIIPEFS